jgi:hypothetical protein
LRHSVSLFSILPGMVLVDMKSPRNLLEVLNRQLVAFAPDTKVGFSM